MRIGSLKLKEFNTRIEFLQIIFGQSLQPSGQLDSHGQSKFSFSYVHWKKTGRWTNHWSMPQPFCCIPANILFQMVHCRNLLCNQGSLYCIEVSTVLPSSGHFYLRLGGWMSFDRREYVCKNGTYAQYFDENAKADVTKIWNRFEFVIYSQL